ncbi:MAG: TetR/AcrR family transcriptional regulator [Eubacteriaceae bacterium]|nr:TetR/AcrR family transcriptional regulator [Eubacteriaceae bacterium]
MKLMEKYEFETLTVRMICDSAKISVGTFYHYFHEKNDLISGILGDIDEYILENIEGKLKSEDELENLKEFGMVAIKKVTNNGYGLSVVINSIPLPSTPEDREKEVERVFLSEPLKIIKRGQEKGQIVDEISAEKITEMFIIAFRGVVVDWARRSGSYNLEETYEQHIKYFVRAIRK